jgi:hypothetical protein
MTTTSQNLTSSTNEMLGTIRRALLDFSDPKAMPTSPSARDLLGGVTEERLYIKNVPMEPRFPNAVMRLITSNVGRVQGLRLDGSLEIEVWGRPLDQQGVVNDICDRFDGAMLTMVRRTQGLMFVHEFHRDDLPPMTAPADSETFAVRLTYMLTIYPQFLTRLVG